jgi:hypothetical protein
MLRRGSLFTIHSGSGRHLFLLLPAFFIYQCANYETPQHLLLVVSNGSILSCTEELQNRSICLLCRTDTHFLILNSMNSCMSFNDDISRLRWAYLGLANQLSVAACCLSERLNIGRRWAIGGRLVNDGKQWQK